MLKPKRFVSTQEAIEILCQCNTGVLSMIGEDGKPYGVPINYICDLSENAIYFHCAKTGKKYEALHHHPNVSFVAVKEAQIIPERFITHYESVLIEGTASFLEEEQEMRQLLTKLCDQLAPGELEKRPEVIDIYIEAVSICKVEISTISGKRNLDY